MDKTTSGMRPATPRAGKKVAKEAAPAAPVPRQGQVPLGRLLPKVAGRSLAKRGAAFAQILTTWPELVGSRLAGHASPEKLLFPRGRNEDATLTIRVIGAFSTEVQHRAPVIVERINLIFGRPLIGRLRLVQGAPRLPQRAAGRPPPRPLGAAARQDLTRLLETVADADLRASLERLGTRVLTVGPKER